MKVAVWGADTFVGSNICNYMLQYTKHDIFGIFTEKPPYRHMEGPRRSRARFDWQITTANHDAIDLRIQVENPDIIIITTDIPPLLQSRFKTCYVGQDPHQVGATRTFMTPEPFGPRQPRDSGIAKLIFSAEPPTDQKKTVIYIKDLYDQLMAFLDTDSKYGYASGFDTSTLQIWQSAKDRSTTIMQMNPILHTLGWYELNTWFN